MNARDQHLGSREVLGLVVQLHLLTLPCVLEAASGGAGKEAVAYSKQLCDACMDMYSRFYGTLIMEVKVRGGASACLFTCLLRVPGLVTCLLPACITSNLQVAHLLASSPAYLSAYLNARPVNLPVLDASSPAAFVGFRTPKTLSFGPRPSSFLPWSMREERCSCSSCSTCRH